MASSIAENGGRSCVNASGVWVTGHAREIAEALAERLAQIRPAGRGRPRGPARALRQPRRGPTHLGHDRPRSGGAGGRGRDRAAIARAGASSTGTAPPTCCPPSSSATRADHPLANREFLFPLRRVVPVRAEEIPQAFGPTLAVTAITNDKPCSRAHARLAPPPSLEPRAHAHLPGELGPAPRGQPLRAPLRAPRLPGPPRRRLTPTAPCGSSISPPGRAGCTAGAACATTRSPPSSLARGHDVSLLPVYTPTLTDEANVSDDHVFFGGISVYLQQHVPLLAPDPRRPRHALGHPGGHQGRHRPRRDRRPEGPGRADRLHPAGRGGLPGQGDPQARALPRRAAALRPRGDPELAPHRPGRAPEARACGGPSSARSRARTCSSKAWASRRTEASALALIARHAAASTASSRRATTTPTSWRGYLGLPRGEDRTSCPSASPSTVTTPRRREASGPFTIGYFARVAPEKGLHLLAEAYRILRREHGPRPRGSRRPATSPPSTAATWPQVEATLARGGPARASSATTAPWTAPRRSPSCARSTCCRSRAPTPSRRASTCSRRWRTACPGCSRATAPSPRCSRRRAAACSSSRTTRGAWPSSSCPWPATATGPRELGRRGRPGRAPALHRGPHGRARRSRSTRSVTDAPRAPRPTLVPA